MHIEPGATKTISFALSADSLTVFDSQERKVFPDGKFEVYVGGNSLAPLVAEFVAGN